MKNLVIAEKPSVARDLAGILGRFQSKDGYLENGEYVITWAIGHLVELADPEDYDKNLKSWNLAALPIVPENFKLRKNHKTAKQFKIVKDLVNRPDIEELICATDAGREGELIFRYIYRLAGCKKPFKRLWLSETTPSAVKKGFENLRPGSEFNPLAYAAEARSRADWLIGINGTRAFTVKHNNLLSVGRVQTPTLALIVNREREIRNFVPTPFWELHVEFTKEDGQKYTGKWFSGDQNRFSSVGEAREKENIVAGQPGEVKEVKQKDTSEQSPLLFNLNDLQKEANKKYGFPAGKTLSIAQALYETKKLITYPRTDSRHMTEDLAGTIPARLTALAGVSEYESFINTANAAGTPGKRYVDGSKVSDHTALLPTEIKPELDKLSVDEQKIYDLVVRRFLAIFYPPARYKQTRVVTDTAGETFLTTGKVELYQGWKAVYALENESEDDDSAGTIPPLSQKEPVQTQQTEVKEKQTQPPKRYTEASLLAVMEGASRLLENKELKEAMKGHGLGTPATRAAIIERLIKVGYIERKKKTLVPTEKGEALIDLVPEIIKSPETTGQWEKTLADIEDGKANPRDFMDGIIQLTRQIVELAGKQEAGSMPQQFGNTLGKCPLCGKDVTEGKKGFGCTGYKEHGCKLVIWKEIAGKKLSDNQVKTLLEKGQTGVIKGFKSKKGNKFEAALKLENGKVEFRFKSGSSQTENNNKAIGTCPICGKEVIEKAKGYGCSGYEEQGCKFVIWKQIAGKKITTKQAQDLMQNGKTGLIKGFKAKTGKIFDAALVLGQDSKVNFEFNGR
ncbi:MAG: DNA topoisomerase III [Firmicutes bacterium]|nr:DNA topoisomerase III [Bacillota bacterium]